MIGGAVLLHRSIFDHEIWKDIPRFRLFTFLFASAVFAKDGVIIAGVHVKRGQYLISYRKLSEKLAHRDNNQLLYYSVTQIKRIVDSLEKDGMILKEKISDEHGTLFTIVNYDRYQLMIHSKNDSAQCFQGLEGACNGQVTGLVTPTTSISPNNEASELMLFPEHVTGLDEGLGGACKYNNKVNNKEINIAKAAPKKYPSFEDIVFPSELSNLSGFVDLYREWYEERKLKGNPLTERAIKMQLKKLLNWHKEGYDILDIISASIENGWSGFFLNEHYKKGKGNMNKQGDTNSDFFLRID